MQRLRGSGWRLPVLHRNHGAPVCVLAGLSVGVLRMCTGEEALLQSPSVRLLPLPCLPSSLPAACLQFQTSVQALLISNSELTDNPTLAPGTIVRLPPV